MIVESEFETATETMRSRISWLVHLEKYPRRTIYQIAGEVSRSLQRTLAELDTRRRIPTLQRQDSQE